MTSTTPTTSPDAWMYVEGPARRILQRKLLHRRDHLAAAAAEHTAHDQVGAELLWHAAEAAEARLRAIFPTTWAEQHKDWASTDAARIHTADGRWSVDCRLCWPNPPEIATTTV